MAGSGPIHDVKSGQESRVTELLAGGGAWAPTVGKFRLQVIDDGPGGPPWESAGETCSIGSAEGNDLRWSPPTGLRLPLRDPGRRGAAAGHRSRQPQRHGRRRRPRQGGLPAQRQPDPHRRGLAAVRARRRRQPPAGLRPDVVRRAARAVGADARPPSRSWRGRRPATRPSCSRARPAPARGRPPRRSIGRARGRADRSWSSTARRSRPTCSRASCSATRRARSPAPSPAGAGAFEEAAGGTIFLDEIGELPLDLQPKLLRALENRQVRPLGTSAYRPIDVRIIAATNRDLRTEVNQGRFRSDLFFRLSVVRIVMPPLRQRPEDLALVVRQLLRRLGASEPIAARLCVPDFVGGLAARRLARERARAAQLPRALPGVRGAHAARRARRGSLGPSPGGGPRPGSPRTQRPGVARSRGSSSATSAPCSRRTAGASPPPRAPPESTGSTSTASCAATA